MGRRALHFATRLLLPFILSLCLVALVSNANADSYTVTISIQGLPANLSTHVYVNGPVNGTLGGGQNRSFIFPTSSATNIITVDFYVPNSVGANGTRYYEKEYTWSFNASGSHIFAYTAQYYLAVETDYSTAGGQGWYDAGSAVPATLKEGEIEESEGTRHVFKGWAGNASGTTLTSNSILMDGPKKAIALWTTQFYLTVDSDPPSLGNLSGSGWYDAGSQADFSASDVVQANEDTRLRFSHWSGAYSSEIRTGSVLMDRPKAVKAQYIAQYLLSVQYDPASVTSSYNDTHAGWYDAYANVQLGPTPTIIELSSVERLRFVGWVDDGSSYPDVSITVFMDKPHKVILSYQTQYYLDVRSSYGSVSGSGWYDKGSTAKIEAVATTGTWPVSYTLSDWRVDPPTGTLAKTDDAWTLTVDRPYVIEAVWNIDYFPLIAIFGGGTVAIVAIAAGVFVSYKRGLFGRSRSGLRLPRLRPAAPGRTRVCSSCGNRVPHTALFCEKCGASMHAPKVESADDKVYNYIVKHEGVISLSKASKDLGIPVGELKRITERLKKKGRLA